MLGCKLTVVGWYEEYERGLKSLLECHLCVKLRVTKTRIERWREMLWSIDRKRTVRKKVKLG